MYSFTTAVCLPLIINLILNIWIFIYVRRSSLRVQPKNNINHQQLRISRRDIFLLKQMIFMFTMFIIGWIPIVSVYIIIALIDVEPVIIILTAYLSQLCVLGIIINLFLCNHELREYLMNKIRQWFCRSNNY